MEGTRGGHDDYVLLICRLRLHEYGYGESLSEFVWYRTAAAAAEWSWPWVLSLGRVPHSGRVPCIAIAWAMLCVRAWASHAAACSAPVAATWSLLRVSVHVEMPRGCNDLPPNNISATCKR